MTTDAQARVLKYEGLRPPLTKAELAYQLEAFFGLRYPSQAVCPGHVAPLDALAEAYFATDPVIIWIASRGLAGKTTMLAGLSLMEFLGQYNVVLLGGSGEQSARAHEVTANGWNYHGVMYGCPECGFINVASEDNCVSCGRPLTDDGVDELTTYAPTGVLDGDPLATKTRSVWGNKMLALTASTKSARGPHPHRLRMDEADEMDLKIIDAAMGQTMETDPGKPPQTILASTHHYESGTMTELLKRAARKGWPVRKWCYKETLASQPGGWLLESNVQRKRGEVTSRMWRIEYDLQRPDEGGTALFAKEALDELFVDGPERDDRLNTYFELEEPEDAADYVTAADWARKSDLSIVATVRYDCEPARLVAWARFFRQPWQKTIGHFNERVDAYGGKAIHDATGIGDVVDAYLTVDAEAFQMVGAQRTELFLNYEHAVELGALELPKLRSLIDVHDTTQRDDLYGGGHPPDELVALALACRVVKPAPRKRKAGKGRVHRVRSF